MPPCAAFECERTGWTFDKIPTETPSSAAASAARWPARPAPITRTSCVGKAAAMLLERLFRPPPAREVACLLARPDPLRPGRGLHRQLALVRGQLPRLALVCRGLALA